MAIEIRMPELDAETEQADLVSWLVAPGDRVEAGDLIAEIETDKSTVEFESPASGVVRELRVAAGTTGVRVGEVLLVLTEADSDAEASQAPAAEAPPAAGDTGQPASPEERGPPAPVASAAVAPPAPETREVAATALARRMAELEGLDLASLKGSGSGGRIVKADVEAALGREQTPRAPSARSAAVRAAPGQTGAGTEADAATTLVPHTRMRRAIASRLSEAKQSIPHFYLSSECAIDALLATRADLNARFHEVHLSVNDFVVCAAALALRDVPAANVSWSEDALVQHDFVHVSVAVATEAGLITPVVRDADRKGLADLSREIRDLAERARDGKLRPNEYRGGTFTVSNLGMFGIDSVYPILNPPEACILGVGAGRAKPAVRGGELVAATLMICTLSADHRALDGAIGARLLSAIQRRLEDPLEMLL